MSFKNSPLRITLIAGLILFVLAGAVLTVLLLTERSIGRIARQEETFLRLLREYDVSAQGLAEPSEFEQLIRDLDRLERRAISVETWLSVLKRRRALAKVYPPSIESYNASIQRALAAFPSSQPIIAFAAAALIRDRAINSQMEETLRTWLPALTGADSPVLNSLRLGLHILLGDFSSPQRAALLPACLSCGGNEDIAINLAILKILENDFRGAAADIQALISPLGDRPPSDEAIRLAAEYHFDFGDILRAAELFSGLEDDTSLLRGADAMFIGGYTASARSLWSLLAATSANESYLQRSLYNLALTAESDEEKNILFERFLEVDTQAVSNVRQAGIIRYSRLLDYNQAIAVLSETVGGEDIDPLLDLELCRRRARYQMPARQAAETWLLLERHGDNEDLYKWAAWNLFSLQFSNETAILIERLQRMDFYGSWPYEYMAIQLMQEGYLEAAAEIFASISGETAGWHVFANLGRIYEARRSPRRALGQYQLAAMKVQNPRAASRIQTRIANNFLVLGYISEALSALLYAVELDPENLTAQLEIDRMILP